MDCRALKLHTPRLLLKDLRVDDAAALFAYRSLPEVTEFQGWTPTDVSDAVGFIEHDICHVLDQPDTWFQLGIFLNATDDPNDDKKLIGDMGIHFLSSATEEIQKPGLTDTVEIGITISPAHQGRGYASEAVRRILDFLFEELHKIRVIASVDPDNHKSMTLMKSVGFQLDGIFPKSVFHRGEWVDDAAFSITLEQWRNHSNSNR